MEKKLSKRHGAVSVIQYREDGFLPQALLNYLVRLGWSHGDQEIFSMQEMIQLFDLSDINKSAAAFNLDKLLWLNQHYIKHGDLSETSAELAWHFKRIGVNTSFGPPLEKVIAAQADRCKTLKEMAEKSRFFYEAITIDAANQSLLLESKAMLKQCRDALNQLDVWEKEKIHTVLNEFATEQQLKLGKVAQPLRLLLTGGTVSPPIDITLELLGKNEVIKRLDAII